MSVDPSWRLALAVVVLVGVAAVVSWRARLGVARTQAVAALRATVQLAAVSLVIVAVIGRLWSSLLFVVLMFVVAVFTTCRRTGVRSGWPWTALAMAIGVLPVLAVVFLTGASPLTGLALIPIAGIIIGNAMTAHTLMGRRLFAELDDSIPSYEAGLALGLVRSEAITEITSRRAAEALVPSLDTTRTVGLVTLPGAFVGVLLGGGTALQAGAAQLLVLIGIMAGQALTVASGHLFITRAQLLPDALKLRLRP